MKILKQLFTLAAAMLLFTACNKNEEFAPEQNSTFPADGIIRVATSVSSPQTRAGMTTANLDDFQLCILNENNPAYTYYVWMRRNGSEWYSFQYKYSSPLMMLWQNKTQAVKVSAVSNMLKGVKDNEWGWGKLSDVFILDNQRDEDNMLRSDILNMTERVIDPAKDLVDGKIQVTLKHSFSKLNLTVKMGTEFNKLDGGTVKNCITDITVGGTNTKARWMIATDSLMRREKPMEIIPWSNTAGYKAGEGDIVKAEAKYECILLPQTVKANDFSVSIRIGERYFSWISPVEVKLHSDTQYNLTLNVGQDVVTVDGFTVIPWSDHGVQDLETD